MQWQEPRILITSSLIIPCCIHITSSPGASRPAGCRVQGGHQPRWEDWGVGECFHSIKRQKDKDRRQIQRQREFKAATSLAEKTEESVGFTSIICWRQKRQWQETNTNANTKTKTKTNTNIKTKTKRVQGGHQSCWEDWGVGLCFWYLIPIPIKKYEKTINNQPGWEDWGVGGSYYLLICWCLLLCF